MLGIEDYGSDVESDNDASSKPLGLSSTSSSNLSLNNSKTKRIKKIEISLPSLPSHDSDTDDRRPAKKPRITSSKGAGASSLLSMLPAPTQPLPVKAKKDKEPERVLGGGNGPGLVFRAPASVQEDGEWDGDEVKQASTSFMPLSIKKGKSNVALDREDSRPQRLPKVSSAPAVDFFSLGVFPAP